MNTKSILGLSLFLSLLFPGCGGGGPVESGRHRGPALTIIGGNHQSGTVGTQLPESLVVRVDDQSGRPLPGAVVSWGVTSGGGSVDPTSTSTGADGTASARWTLGTRAGTNNLTASTGTLAVSFVATGMPGPVAALAITWPVASIKTGDFVQLQATFADAYGNPIPEPPLLPSEVTWTSSNATVLKVTSTGLLLALDPGLASISASANDLTDSLTLTVDPSPGMPGTIEFSVGPEEVVFRYSTDRCATLDLPDTPAHALRLADGSLILVAGHATGNYVMVGQDFSSLQRRCSPTLVSDEDPYPESYNNEEWLHSVYRDGDVIYGLIHNEYHDPFAPNCIEAVWPNICWYNSVNSAVSTDNGLTFTHAPAPAHAIAPPWLKWDPQGAPTPSAYGYFNPSNIVRAQDGLFYVVFRAIDRVGTQVLCVMRTHTLGDPTSWRAWDGTGFNLQMTSPYTGPAPPMCGVVASFPDVVPEPTLTYNTYLEKYMLVGSNAKGTYSPVCGMYFSLSSDLINWTPMELIRTAYQGWEYCSPASAIDVYPSLIDHDDTTVNFEMAGRTPYLYFTRWNSSHFDTLDRDLVRAPLIITAH